jgi:hypothetical protein
VVVTSSIPSILTIVVGSLSYFHSFPAAIGMLDDVKKLICLSFRDFIFDPKCLPTPQRIDSNVSNCDIEVDGAYAGNTPSELSLAAGTHKITISQKGYVPWSRTVLVTSSGLRLRAQLDIASPAPVASPVTATTAHQ